MSMSSSPPPSSLQAQLPGIAALCFDLDGTLLDTIPDLAAAANAMLTDLGHAPRPVGEVATYVGKGADRLIERMLTAAGVPAAIGTPGFATARERFHANYRRLNGQAARIYPGVAEGLRLLEGLGLKMAVVTNKPQAYIAPLLEQFGLDHHFDFCIGGDALPVRKPDPGQLLEACARWQLPADRVLMVGDSLNDTQAARAAGMPVVILPYGYNEGRPLDSVDADAVIQRIDELAGWLAGARKT